MRNTNEHCSVRVLPCCASLCLCAGQRAKQNRRGQGAAKADSFVSKLLRLTQHHCCCAFADSMPVGIPALAEPYAVSEGWGGAEEWRVESEGKSDKALSGSDWLFPCSKNSGLATTRHGHGPARLLKPLTAARAKPRNACLQRVQPC